MGVGVGMRKSYVTNLNGRLLPVYEIYIVVKYSPRGNYGYTNDYLKNVKPRMYFIDEYKLPLILYY